MSDTLKQIVNLIRRGEVRVSEHGYDELAKDTIIIRDLIASLSDATVLEDYPDYPKGPCVLVLQLDHDGNPVHAVWGIPKGKTGPAVLIAAYRPDPEKWTQDFTRRKK